MGQVFRLIVNEMKMLGGGVLIPDEWGKSSDRQDKHYRAAQKVLIPDEWGKSSDTRAVT